MKRLQKTSHRLLLTAGIALAMQALLLHSLRASPDTIREQPDLSGIRVSLAIKNAKLDSVFKEIERQTVFTFFYEEKLIDKFPSVSVQARQRLLKSVLQDMSTLYRLQFKQINYSISVKTVPAAEKQDTTIAPITVSGKVTDQTHNPIAGVSVLVEGSSTGTTTDADGNYNITIEKGVSLSFSFIGHKTEVREVGDQETINVILDEDIKGLDEVVVIGYGVQKKSDLTGAVASADIAHLTETPNVSLFQGLQGTVSGLNIGAVDEAGENPLFTIRGQNTLSNNSGDNAPLIVVDGIIYRGNLVDLNTADIKSVDILKDISSTAIYGSQASNGVILITTKKGGGKRQPTINYNASYSFQQPSNKLQPMGGEELDKFLRDVFWEQGSRIGPDYLTPNPDFTLLPYFRNAAIATNYENGATHDWWGNLTRNGSVHNQNISVAGGDEWVKYFLSGGMTDVKGFMINEAYKKYNYRINVDAQVNKWISLGVESFLTNSDYSGVSPGVSTAFTMFPWAPAYEENGDYTLTPDSRGLSPYLQIQQDDLDKRLNLFANLHAELQIPAIKGFKYRVNFSQNYRTADASRFNPWGASYTGNGYKNNNQNYDWILDNIFTYSKDIGDKHRINATLLYGVEERNYSFTNAGAQNFVNDLLGYNRLQAGDPTLNTVSSGKERENSLYTMGRLFYSYDSKYMITGTVRRDGFSGFGSKKKVGIFPSVAAAWVISEEGFYGNMTKIADYLKLRISYGESGRRAVGRYATQAIVSSSPAVIFGDGGITTQGQWISTLANDNLGWETTRGINIGLDFGFLNSRINGNIEYYNNNTRDILYNVQLPTMTGFSSIADNIGKVHNWGIELSLNAVVVNKKDFRWESGVVYARNRNEIVSILGPWNDQDGDGKEDGLIANSLFIGEPQNVNYNYEVIGIWQLADKDAGTIPSGFMPGTYKLADLNNDGKISAANDRRILGYVDPAYRIGWSNTFRYKNLNLYIFINSIQGGKNFYQANLSFHTNEWHKLDQLVYSTPPAGGWDYWMPENPDAKFRRPDNPSQLGINTGPHEQRNFIRIQDISLSYNLNSPFLKKIGMNRLKVFISGKNLFTITKWEGWDPETGVGFVPGRPVMKSYTLGLNLDI